MIDQLIAEYVDFTLKVKNDGMLDFNVKADIMQKMAGSLAQLVPLVNGGEAELQIKREEHAMNLQAKQQELALKQQEHQMKLGQSQSSHMMKLQQSQESHQNALRQSVQNKSKQTK